MKQKNTFWLIILLLIFATLWFRLFYLQIIHGWENRLSAQDNRIRINKIPSLRGIIYDRFKKVLVRNTPQGREYLFPEALAHVLGYIGKVDEQEIKNSLLGQDDLVGKTGIEKEYDADLRGKDGRVLVETDSQGKVVREIKKEEPEAGKDLDLAIDFELQNKAYSLLNNRKGVIIASDPKTGEILSLVSSPSFDPNLLTLNQPGINKILNDTNEPMFNRAIAGLYPPGSTFKIITALAALEAKKITKNTQIEDTGTIKVGDYSYGNWYFLQYGSKDGSVDIVKALQRSNDIFFYHTGEMLGIEKLASFARNFGLGKALGIDLPGEANGLIPTPQWKKETKTENWYLGDTYITAIGQGNLLLTPLQVNAITAAVANNGKVCSPHLLKDKKADCRDLKFEEENLNLVKKGMTEACSKGGTASVFFDFKPQVACKTGTAEYGLTGRLLNQDQTHAWFTVFAPAHDPKIAVTVLLEGAGEGSKVSAPIARDLLKYWFEKK